MRKKACLKAEACAWAGKQAEVRCAAHGTVCGGLQKRRRCRRRAGCAWSGEGKGWKRGRCAEEEAPPLSPPGGGRGGAPAS